MKSLKQIAESIRIDLKQVTDESYLDQKEEYLYDKINGIRASLIRETLKEDGSLDSSFYQDYGFDVETLQEFHFNITSSVKTFYLDLPFLVPGIGMKSLRYVGDDDFTTPGFKIGSMSEMQSSDGALYTSQKPIASVIGNKCILKNIPKGTRKLFVIGLYMNPLDVVGFDENSPYPVPSTYKLEMLVKKDLLSTWGFPLDVLKSMNDETVMGQRQDGRSKSE